MRKKDLSSSLCVYVLLLWRKRGDGSELTDSSRWTRNHLNIHQIHYPFYFLASPLFILHFHWLNSIEHFRRAGWLDWGRCKHTPTGKDKCVFTRISESGLMTRCHDRREPKLRWTFSPLRASWDLPATHSNSSSQPLDPSHPLCTWLCVCLSQALLSSAFL